MLRLRIVIEDDNGNIIYQQNGVCIGIERYTSFKNVIKNDDILSRKKFQMLRQN